MTRQTRASKRTPVGRRNVLTAPEKKGFKRRYVNIDDSARINMFQEAGWKIVDEKTQMGDENVGQASQVGSTAHKPVGGGTNAVLMEIKDEWYAEDQAAKEAQLKEKEQGMLQDENGNAPDPNKTYGGLKVNHGSKTPMVQIE